MAQSLHQAAVADDAIGIVVDNLVAPAGVAQPLRQRHPHGIAEALRQRPGGGLDAVARVVLRMPGRVRAELTEAFDLVDGDGVEAA